MSDIYDIYKRMENDEIILAFKGDITEELLSSLLQILESKLDASTAELRTKKKVNHLLVESLQNLHRHMEYFTEEEKTDHPSGSAMLLVCREEQGAFRIVTGNYMLNSNVENLKAKIDTINGMTQEELKVYYLEALKNSELSDKGGAGLGLIDMARKSGHKIDYRFDPVNDRISFFSQVLHVD